jgi:hypothetical protein
MKRMKMTKEEKIIALHQELNEEYAKLSETSLSDISEYDDEDWKTLRIECGSEKDIMPAFKWANRTITDHFSDKFTKPGVYDILFCVSYRGEFDNSEEANQNRAKIKAAQELISNKAKVEMAKIEAEYSEVEQH